jgi:hypothetical protein
MTPDEHIKRVRQIAFQLQRADYGLGMPRDYELVMRLRSHLEAATTEAVKAIHDAFVNGPLSIADAIMALKGIGEEEAERVVDEWADAAQAEKDGRDGHFDYSDLKDF